MKTLDQTFEGRGEMRGFKFTQIKSSPTAYIYHAVDEDGCEHYEVFEHHENERFGCVSYPKSGSFGKWAWCYRTLADAERKFAEL